MIGVEGRLVRVEQRRWVRGRRIEVQRWECVVGWVLQMKVRSVRRWQLVWVVRNGPMKNLDRCQTPCHRKSRMCAVVAVVAAVVAAADGEVGWRVVGGEVAAAGKKHIGG